MLVPVLHEEIGDLLVLRSDPLLRVVIWIRRNLVKLARQRAKQFLGGRKVGAGRKEYVAKFRISTRI